MVLTKVKRLSKKTFHQVNYKVFQLKNSAIKRVGMSCYLFFTNAWYFFQFFWRTSVTQKRQGVCHCLLLQCLPSRQCSGRYQFSRQTGWTRGSSRQIGFTQFHFVYLSTYWLSFDSGVSCTGVYIILHCCVMTLHTLVVYTCVSTYFHGAMFREKMPGFVQITTFTISSDSESDNSAPVGILYILHSGFLCRIVKQYKV